MREKKSFQTKKMRKEKKKQRIKQKKVSCKASLFALERQIVCSRQKLTKSTIDMIQISQTILEISLTDFAPETSSLFASSF